MAAKNTRKIITILSRYIDYRNHEILREIVTKFCGSSLQSNMQDYCKLLGVFETSTTVDIYIIAVPDEVSEDEKMAFSKMVVRINKPSSQCTLHDVRKLNETIVESSGVCPHSVYISGVADKCVDVTLSFPKSATGWIISVFAPDFMENHNISEISLDGVKLPRHYKTDDDVVRKRLVEKHLLSSCEGGHLVYAVHSLNNGANINVCDEIGRSPLHLACLRRNLQIVRLLTFRGANINLKIKSKFKKSLERASPQEQEILRLIHARQSKRERRRDSGGGTPLMFSISSNDFEIMQDLLYLGAEVNAQDDKGNTAIILASYGKYDMVVELIRMGANFNEQNEEGNSALIMSATRGDKEIVVELVRAGAILDLQNEDGESALLAASFNSHTDVVIELVSAGANLELQTKNGDSVLIRAAQSWNPQPGIVRELMKPGANPNQLNQEGLSALMIASRKGKSDTVDAILEGKDVIVDLQENVTGWTALHFAAERGDSETVKLLLEVGANSQIKDKNGLTALQITEVREAEGDIEQKYPWENKPGGDFAGVIALLVEREKTSDIQSADNAQDTTPTSQEGLAIEEEGPTDHSHAVSQDDVLDTSQITPQYRRQSNITEAIINLANISTKRAMEIFANLDRRLKSANQKEQWAQQI